MRSQFLTMAGRGRENDEMVNRRDNKREGKRDGGNSYRFDTRKSNN